MTPPRLCSIASIQTGDGGPRPVTVEVHIADGLPGYEITGVGDQERRASRDRIRAAFTNTGLAWPEGHITVNVAPSGHGAPDPAVDVAIAAGILAVTGRLDPAEISTHAYVGQLGLDGGVTALSTVDRSTIAELTGLPPANLGHLRDLAHVPSPAAAAPSPAEQIVAAWQQPHATGIDPDTGLGGIA